MLKADHTQNNNIIDSMKPDHIISKNKAIPVFFFEYFMQENMSSLLDVALEKTCFFEYTETDGHDALSTRNVSVQKGIGVYG